ncbi:MAG: TIM barrel protein [Clostridia bacterium]|nr:TIM barrel protein [Clostridia bacterium]
MKKYIIDDFGYCCSYENKIKMIKNIGFDGIFLNMRENKKPINLDIILEKIKICKKNNVDILFAHLPIDERLNLFWSNGFSNKYFNEVVENIRILYNNGVKSFVIHSYYKKVNNFHDNNIIKTFFKLKEITNKLDINIFIENVDYFFQDKLVFENLSNTFNICYDMGHENAFYLENQKNFIIDNFSDKIYALHLHDNNGLKDEHKIPFSENCNVDFLKLKKIKHIKSLPLTLESKMNKTNDFFIAQQFLKEAFSSLLKIEKLLN